MNFWREAVPVFSPPLHLNLRRQLCLLLLPIQLLTPRGDKLQYRQSLVVEGGLEGDPHEFGWQTRGHEAPRPGQAVLT